MNDAVGDLVKHLRSKGKTKKTVRTSSGEGGFKFSPMNIKSPHKVLETNEAPREAPAPAKVSKPSGSGFTGLPDVDWAFR